MTDSQFDEWDARVEQIWADAPGLEDEELMRLIVEIVSERPADDPAALFELASANDSIGREFEAEPLYRRAMAGDLDDDRRFRAIIQFSSTLRNVGKLEESAELLTAAHKAGPNSVTGDAASAFLALTLIDLGREREATIAVLRALIPHLPRYHRSMNAYVDALEGQSDSDS